MPKKPHSSSQTPSKLKRKQTVDVPQVKEETETRFSFTRKQRARLAEFYEEFENVVREHDPHYRGKSWKVTEWKQQKVADLLEEDLFQTLDTSKETLKDWAEVKTIPVHLFYLFIHCYYIGYATSLHQSFQLRDEEGTENGTKD